MRGLVARHPNTSPELYERLARQKYNGMYDGFYGILESPHITPVIAQRFLSLKDGSAIWHLLRNPKLPLDFLLELLKSSVLYKKIRSSNRKEAREAVKISLASRSDIPPKVRKKLSRDKNWHVQEALKRSSSVLS